MRQKKSKMEIKNFLNEGDIFAANAGAQLTIVSEGNAQAVMTVTRQHLNAGGVCQGGAIFTLADLALAAVMNGHGVLTFSLQSNIAFLQSAKEGDTLTAEATEIFDHHKIPYFEVKITNQHGALVCAFTAIAYHTKQTIG